MKLQNLTLVCLLAELSHARSPNILFILTDDQDLHMESVDHMQHLKVCVRSTAYQPVQCTHI